MIQAGSFISLFIQAFSFPWWLPGNKQWAKNKDRPSVLLALLENNKRQESDCQKKKNQIQHRVEFKSLTFMGCLSEFMPVELNNRYTIVAFVW